MKRIKHYVTAFPEVYVILLVFLAGYTPPFTIHPVIIMVIGLLILQILYNNQITGMILTVLLIVINLYLPMALISEINEFPGFTKGAGEMLMGGLIIFACGILVNILLIRKYIISRPGSHQIF